LIVAPQLIEVELGFENEVCEVESFETSDDELWEISDQWVASTALLEELKVKAQPQNVAYVMAEHAAINPNFQVGGDDLLLPRLLVSLIFLTSQNETLYQFCVSRLND